MLVRHHSAVSQRLTVEDLLGVVVGVVGRSSRTVITLVEHHTLTQVLHTSWGTIPAGPVGGSRRGSRLTLPLLKRRHETERARPPYQHYYKMHRLSLTRDVTPTRDVLWWGARYVTAAASYPPHTLRHPPPTNGCSAQLPDHTAMNELVNDLLFPWILYS